MTYEEANDAFQEYITKEKMYPLSRTDNEDG